MYRFGQNGAIERVRTYTTPYTDATGTGSESEQSYDASWYLTSIRYTSGKEVTYSYTVESNFGSSTINRRGSVEKYFGEVSRTSVRDLHLQRVHLTQITYEDKSVHFTRSTNRLDFTEEPKIDSIVVKVDDNTLMSYALEYMYLGTVDNKRLLLDSLTVLDAAGSVHQTWGFSYLGTGVWIPDTDSYAIDHWGFFNGQTGNDDDGTGEKLPEHYREVSPQNFVYQAGINRQPIPTKSQIGLLSTISHPAGGNISFEYEPNTYSGVGGEPVLTQIVEFNGCDNNQCATVDTVVNVTVSTDPFTIDLNSGNTLALKSSVFGIEVLGEPAPVPAYKDSCSIGEDYNTKYLRAYLVGVSNPSYNQELPLNPFGTLCPMQSVPAGTYKVEVDVPANFTDQAEVSLTALVEDEVNVLVGPGHRVQKVTYDDGNPATVNRETTYSYTLFSDTTKSSGMLARKVKYYDCDFALGGLCMHAVVSDSHDGVSEQGPQMGYSNIEVSEQNGGYTRYYFSNSGGGPGALNNVFTDIPSDNVALPGMGWHSYGWGRGKVYRVESFDSGGELLTRQKKAYKYLTKNTQAGTYSELFSDNYEIPEFHTRALSGATQTHFLGKSSWISISYRYPVWGRIESEEMISFDSMGSDSLVVKTEYTYDDNHKQIVTQTQTNSRTGEQRKTTYRYAHEQYAAMADSNMLTQPYSVLLEDGANNDLSKSWTEWNDGSASGFIAPGGIWRAWKQSQWEGSNSGDVTAPSTPGEAITVQKINEYNALGNVIEMEDAAGVVSSFHYDNTGTQVVGVFSNTPQNDIDVVYMDDVYQSSFGPLPNGLVSYKNGNGTLTYSMGEEDQVPHLRVEIDNLTNRAAGVRLSVGSQPAGKQFRLDLEYKVTEGVFHVKGFNSTTATHTNWITSGVTSGWVKTSVDFVTATDGHLYLRSPWNGTGAPNTTFYLRHIRIYPVEAQAQSANYHATFQTPVYVMDQSGSAVTYEYDDAGRLNGTRNTNGYQTTAYSYGYSAAKNGGVYDALAPNTVESITYLDPFMYDDFSSSANWTDVDPIHTLFNVQMAGETTVRMGTGSGYETIFLPLSEEKVAAKIDFYPDQTTGGTPHIMLDKSGNRFAVHYVPASDRFRIQYQKNSGGYQNPFTFPLNAPIDQWYTIELSKKEGILTAWVYPKGEGRDPDNSYTLDGFSTTWTPNFALSGNGNYFYAANLSIAKSWQSSMEYVDGLGRSIQSQMRDASNTAIITDTRYNERGLPEVASRPIEENGVTSYRPNLLEGTGAFTPGQQLNSTSDVEDYYDPLVASGTEDFAYTYTQYEDAPMARVTEQRLPGGASFDVQTSYGLNTTETFATAAQGSTPAKTWAANTLTKTVTTDPSNRRTITYTDGWGQTIASGVDMNGDSKLTRSSTDLVTEFAYDTRGNLVRVEDPKGLATTYTYNQLGQLTGTSLPDQENSNSYRYDDKGRLRFTQHAGHKESGGDLTVSLNTTGNSHFERTISPQKSGRLSFTISTTLNEADYRAWIADDVNGDQLLVEGIAPLDEGWETSTGKSMLAREGTYKFFGRTVSNGMDQTENTNGSLQFRAFQYAYTKYDDLERVTETGEYYGSTSFSSADPNNDSFPTSDHQKLVEYKYDAANGYSGAQNLKGRLAQVWYYDPTDLTATPHKTFYSYNELGLVEWMKHDYNGMGLKTVAYSYDELGRQTGVHVQEGAGTDELHLWYSYDGFGRLHQVHSSTSRSGTRTERAEYQYFPDGQVRQLDLGSGTQVVDYTYTVQGWMDRLNNPGSLGSDQFAMDLAYANNGNITHQQWVQREESATAANYYYGYDNANRLTTACYGSNGCSVSSTGAYDAGYTYDDNGNITKLNRIGSTGSSRLNSLESVSFLTNTNKYSSVSLRNGTGSAVTNNFGYDARGNMVSSDVQNLKNTTYDWRNLPSWVVAGTQAITYAYDPDGNRIHKQVVGGSGQFYIRGADGKTIAVYNESGTIQFFNILAGSAMIGQIRR
ncbi:MAG: DUF6443 domain-containing protein [Bacteroidota bacterium]